MEHIDINCRVFNSEQLMTICSIRILSIFKVTFQLLNHTLLGILTRVRVFNEPIGKELRVDLLEDVLVLDVLEYN